MANVLDQHLGETYFLRLQELNAMGEGEGADDLVLCLTSMEESLTKNEIELIACRGDILADNWRKTLGSTKSGSLSISGYAMFGNDWNPVRFYHLFNSDLYAKATLFSGEVEGSDIVPIVGGLYIEVDVLITEISRTMNSEEVAEYSATLTYQGKPESYEIYVAP